MAEVAQEQLETEDEKAGVFFSPAALIMLPLAVVVDVSEFFVEGIPYVGQIISIMIDVVAIIFIGGWIWFRSGTMTVSQKAQARVAKAAKWARRLKWLRPLLIIIEFIPIVGSLPLWVLVVYFELKYS